MTQPVRQRNRLPKPTRRELVQWIATGVGVGVGVGRMTCPSNTALPEERVAAADEQTASDLAGRGAEIVEQAYQLGRQYESDHGGCAQCTLAALQDALPFLADDRKCFRAAGPLDGGATPVGLQNCGSFTGAGMAIGYLWGRQRKATFEGTNEQAHALIHQLYQKFEEHYGSVLCKDVREKAESDCPEVVGRAAKWTAQILIDAFNNQGPDKTGCEQKEKEKDEPTSAAEGPEPGKDQPTP